MEKLKKQIIKEYNHNQLKKVWKIRKAKMSKKSLKKYFSKLGKLSGEARRKKKLSTSRA